MYSRTSKLRQAVQSVDQPGAVSYRELYRENPLLDILLPSYVQTKCLLPEINLRVWFVANAVGLLLQKNLIDIRNLRGKIVDIGCGSGASAYVLKQFGGSVVGVDRTPSCIRKVIEQGILSHYDVYVGDGFHYLDEELKPSSVDMITALLISKIPQVEKLHYSADRVLRHGGQLLVSAGLEDSSAIRKYSRLGEIEDCLVETCLVYTKS